MHPTRIFKTPEELWKAFEEYINFCKLNPVKKMVFVGKDGNKDYEEIQRPLTMDGFECFCYENHGCVNQYFDNKDGYYSDFVTICTHVKKSIRENQIVGGMAGIYNSSITQRLNGLTEKTENKNEHSGTIEITMDLSNG